VESRNHFKNGAELKSHTSKNQINKNKSMKNFGTLLIFVLMVTMTLESYSQTFGIKGGLNFATMIDKYDGSSYDSKSINGYHLGVTADFPLTEMFSFESGLQLSTKGNKYNAYSDRVGNYEEKYKLTYLDIPLTLKARYDINGIKLYGLFGPYVGIGLSGNFYSSTQDAMKVLWGSSEKLDGVHLKRLDYGLNIGAGVEIKVIQIGLTYGLGLANISGTSHEKMSNRVLSLSVGYLFGKK
jgi:outer membrane protein W